MNSFCLPSDELSLTNSKRDTFRDTWPKNGLFDTLIKKPTLVFMRVGGRLRGMAEGVGFEPTEPFGSPVFKTGAIDHSTTPPWNP